MKTDIIKIDASASHVVAVQLENLPSCVVCGSVPKRILNIVTKNQGLTGFTVCSACETKPLNEILDAVAWSLANDSNTKYN